MLKMDEMTRGSKLLTLTDTNAEMEQVEIYFLIALDGKCTASVLYDLVDVDSLISYYL